MRDKITITRKNVFLNVYDEDNCSKADVIQQYASRLQHSKNQLEWHFSNPSAPTYGVDREMSNAKTNLWNTVYSTYPSLKGKDLEIHKTWKNIKIN